MSKLPVRGGEQVVEALIRIGFVVIRQRGSHVILSRGSALVVVPVHRGRDLPIGTLKQIMKAGGLKMEDL